MSGGIESFSGPPANEPEEDKQDQRSMTASSVKVNPDLDKNIELPQEQVTSDKESKESDPLLESTKSESEVDVTLTTLSWKQRIYGTLFVIVGTLFLFGGFILVSSIGFSYCAPFSDKCASVSRFLNNKFHIPSVVLFNSMDTSYSNTTDVNTTLATIHPYKDHRDRLPQEWDQFCELMRSTPDLLNNIQSIKVISVFPSSNGVILTIDSKFLSHFAVNGSHSVGTHPSSEVELFSFENTLTFQLGKLDLKHSLYELPYELPRSLMSFAHQWNDTLYYPLQEMLDKSPESLKDNSTRDVIQMAPNYGTNITYSFESVKLSEKSLPFMILVTFSFFFILCMFYIKFLLEESLHLWISYRQEVKNNPATTRLGTFFSSYFPKRWAELFGSKEKTFKFLDSVFNGRILSILVTVVMFATLLDSLTSHQSIVPSSHRHAISFQEFRDHVAFGGLFKQNVKGPGALIDNVTVRVDDLVATVNIKQWSYNETFNLDEASCFLWLKDVKKFYFPFVSAVALEAKLDDILAQLPPSHRFSWMAVLGHFDEAKPKTIWSFLSPDLIFYVVLLGLMQMQLWSTMGGSDFMNVETDIATRFKDVAGLDEAKEEIKEVVEILKNPEKFQQMGAVIPKGVLMSGPSGTGKTLLAKAIAGEANCSFISLSGSSFDEVYVGVGSSRVRKLFKKARRSAPCIIFIDEIDALGKRGRHNSATDTTLNQLLVEMDGFPGGSSRENIVVVLAATNRPQLIDSALKRPGRFDRHVTVALPDRNGRRDIFKVHLSAIKLASPFPPEVMKDLQEKLLLANSNVSPNQPNESDGKMAESKDETRAQDLELKPTENSASDEKSQPDNQLVPVKPKPTDDKQDLIMKYADKLSFDTTGFSGADIKNICNEAAILACRMSSESVNLKHFDQAIERVIAGLAKNQNTISPKEKRVLAYHEAGHATIAYYLEHSDPLVKVSIVPRSGVSAEGSGGQTLGFAQYSPQDKYLYSTEMIIEKMCVTLGGRTAEELFFSTITSGAQDDLQKVTRMAYWLVTELGMNDEIGWISFPNPTTHEGPKMYSEATASKMDEQVTLLISQVKKRTMEMMKERREQVEKVAKFLLEKEVLLAKDMEILLGPRPFATDAKSMSK